MYYGKVKTAILLHGTGGDDKDYFWFGDTKQRLEANGYQVWWPQLPNADRPNLQDALDFVFASMPQLDSQSVIIGHSSAGPLILSILERLEAPIAKAILVSGFYNAIEGNELTPLMLQDSYDWRKIRANAAQIYFLNSDNDPWQCTDQQARPAAQMLNAPLIVMFGQGHMGSDSFNQSYREFPLVKQLLEIN